MKITNSMSGKKEEFVPLKKGKVKMYACGITVYDLSHIGHARQAIDYAMITDYLRYRGYHVTYVRNYTDVDDKIIKRANELGRDALEFSAEQIRETEKDMAALHVTDADINTKASEYIPQIIKVVEGLIKKGHAYVTEKGDVYFSVKTDKNYGKLSHRKVEELRNGVRIEVDEEKEDPVDFALWKSAKPGEIYWESPWGKGRPGWHIECSAMALDTLGETIDIHGGGRDLIFPHHENEIAQSESYLGHKWCNYWFHVHHLNDKTGKMSKSKGDFLTVSLLESKGYNPLVYRMFCLQSHYRKPLEFSYEVMDNVKSAYEKLLKKIAGLSKEGEVDEAVYAEYRRKFEDALCNDLNTSMAITVLYDLLKADCNDVTKRKLAASFDEVLSLGLFDGEKAEEKADDVDAELVSYIEAKIAERKEAKKAKDFAKADAIREELLQKGIVLEDTREGVKWKMA